MRRKRSAALSVVLSATLAVSLCPALAIADESVGGGVSPSVTPEEPAAAVAEEEGAAAVLSASVGTPVSGVGEAGALAKGAKASSADYSWYGDGSATEYTISTPAQLFGFANIANGDDGQTADNFKDKTVKLACDIDLGGSTWKPIGTFAGTFDGCSHVIKNFEMGSIYDGEGYQYCCFFKDIAWPGGLVCNLTIQDVTANIGSKGRFGTVACYVGGGNDKDYADHQISNVHIKNVNVTSTSADVPSGRNVLQDEQKLQRLHR